MEATMDNVTIEHSAELGELAKALCKTQGELEPAMKDSNNPFFKSKYADLKSVMNACRGPMTANGLSVAQFPSMAGTTACLATILMHSSGQWIRSLAPLNPTKNDPQGLGSAITYMRRYMLASAIGVWQEDDDGNDASRPAHNGKPATSRRETPANGNGQNTNGKPQNTKAQFVQAVREWSGVGDESIANACRDTLRACGAYVEGNPATEAQMKVGLDWIKANKSRDFAEVMDAITNGESTNIPI
jgi:hypothetical protein